MSRRIPHLAFTVAVLLAALALALVPAASAGRYGPGFTPAPAHAALKATPAPCHQYCSAAGRSLSLPSRFVRTTITTTSNAGFQWFDVVTAFGVACGALLLVMGVFVIKRRSPVVPAKTAG